MRSSNFTFLPPPPTHTHTLTPLPHTQVLEPNWVLLEKNLRSVHTIDDVLTAHNDFLDRSLRDCLLSDKEVLKIISRLLVVCEHFTDYLREADMTQEQHKGKMSLTQLEITKRRTKSLLGVARLPSGEVLEGGADPHKLRSRLLSRYIILFVSIMLGYMYVACKFHVFTVPC